ncbi:MAG: phosphoribosylformylglycinamidine synthase [Myxococcota bacterium]|nr:phosphoribosylformylglycinamidine synthase [Myxococcota bacterium]
MEHLFGQSATTPFQVERLREAAGFRGLQTAEVFFVDAHAPLSTEERGRLGLLLQETSAPRATAPDWVVVPRVGTLSPWSSKATEIAAICGLSSVRRLERGVAVWVDGLENRDALLEVLCDPMTQSVLSKLQDAQQLFVQGEPSPVRHIDLGSNPVASLDAANRALGLALSSDEVEYLAENYAALGRNPTDVELLMFSQANSEHCRHKIFNASWTVDGDDKDHSLFSMIRNTHSKSPGGVLSAYSDNAAVIAGHEAGRFFPETGSGIYRAQQEAIHIAIKVETHNHPTGISPHPGAATGSGGEIRDEGATGRGGKPKAGLAGFSVSDLQIPSNPLPWEDGRAHPARLASPLQIMTEGPLGAALFNNEFGRPNLCGYFRTFHQEVQGDNRRERRGFHKPIMIAGGYGSVRPGHVEKKTLPVNATLVALGGPAMLIGLGGGSASSLDSGAQSEALDFASVQRANPEMQRRCQEVIDRCWAMGPENPIESIHDVGAGGLSNAFPELVHDSGRGGVFQLRAIPNAEPQLSPVEIWCNEAQERYVLGILDENMDRFVAICERENAPFAIVGRTTDKDELRLHDTHFENAPIDMPLSMLLGKPPRMHRVDQRTSVERQPVKTSEISMDEAASRVLRLPTVASKSFLITIGDRSITGMVARDQMVGPWQVPVADVAVTTAAFDTLHGEAMAMGERSPLALLDAAASGRMAIGEALTNIAAADIAELGDVKLSANWMVAADFPGEGANLYDTVEAVGRELCPQLGIAIPVGKDSMSMRAKWSDSEGSHQVTSPLSLVVTAFAPVGNARDTLTPELRLAGGETDLWVVDLGRGKHRLGGSAFGYVQDQLGARPPNVDSADDLKSFFCAVQELRGKGLLLAYHDRSDGGLWATLCEMAFAARCGIEVDLAPLQGDPVAALFCEELGAVIQVGREHRSALVDCFTRWGLEGCLHRIGVPTDTPRVVVRKEGAVLLDRELLDLLALWTETSYTIQSLRDNPRCAQQERDAMLDPKNQGLSVSLTYELSAPSVPQGRRPRVAILREQGVNGQVEMAAAFERVGFEAVDVHMNDLRTGRMGLESFRGLVACGGFSYGDVLGAGGGWAKSILFHPGLREEFRTFFERGDTFSLGVCNGCQMLSQLKDLIPGAEHWPSFVRNESVQFEARLSQVEILESPSILLQGMAGSRMPIPVAHGEGRVSFAGTDSEPTGQSLAAMRYVDSRGEATEVFPANPNGSAGGLTAFTSRDGRATIMMPHPERAFRTVQFSWHPTHWGEEGPWARLFQNARSWVG